MAAKVVIGLVGTKLDQAGILDGVEAWRPSVAVCGHKDLPVARFELLCQEQFRELAEDVAAKVREISPETEVRIHHLVFSDPWDLEQVYGALYDFAHNYQFDTENEEYYIHITTGTHISQITLFLLVEACHFPARLIQSSPPLGSKHGRYGSYKIIDLDLSAYNHILSRFEKEQTDAVNFLKYNIQTRNERFNKLIERIGTIALASPDPIILTGPTGAGKTRLATRLYELIKNRHKVEGPFVAVNCATLRGDAAMATLFGHTRGAFTGAVRERPGLLRQAHRGVLFLDEIGELGTDEQAMLLRALETKSFFPMGSDHEVQSDFRLIVGTNSDLSAQVAAGTFRDDLLARINLWTFQLPGLSERLEDLEPNIDYELEQFTRTSGRRVVFTRDARERFLQFAYAPDALWTSNFRDLNAAIRRMATLAHGGRITSSIVDEEAQRLRKAWTGSESGADSALRNVLGDEATVSLDRFDRVQLADVIEICTQARSMSEAGRRLFANSRTKKRQPNDADRLRKYLGRFGLQWESIRALRDKQLS